MIPQSAKLKCCSLWPTKSSSQPKCVGLSGEFERLEDDFLEAHVFSRWPNNRHEIINITIDSSCSLTSSSREQQQAATGRWKFATYERSLLLQFHKKRPLHRFKHIFTRDTWTGKLPGKPRESVVGKKVMPQKAGHEPDHRSASPKRIPPRTNKDWPEVPETDHLRPFSRSQRALSPTVSQCLLPDLATRRLFSCFAILFISWSQ